MSRLTELNAALSRDEPLGHPGTPWGSSGHAWHTMGTSTAEEPGYHYLYGYFGHHWQCACERNCALPTFFSNLLD